MQDTLAATLTPHGGEPLRFGGDEPDAHQIAQRPSFGSQIPGGFSDGSIVVARPDDIAAIDAPRFEFAPGRFYGEANRGAYEGRVVGIPHVGVNEIELRFEGHAAALSDLEGFREIYVDRDLNSWGQTTALRRKVFLDLNDQLNEPSVIQDGSTGGAPSLEMQVQGPWAVAAVVEAWYDAHGIPIGSVYYAWRKGVGVGGGGSNWYWDIIATTDDSFASSDATGDLEAAATTGSGTLLTTTATRKFVRANFQFAAANAGTSSYALWWTALQVFGNHGLTKRGTAPNQGFYASDVIAHAIAKAAPQLNFTAGDSIEAGTFVIPHLTFMEGTTAQEVIEQVTALGGGSSLVNDWGVYEDREFFWKTPGTYGRTWRIRLDEASLPTSEGPDVRGRANGVLVTYQDAAGTTRTVGPPGSGADATSTDLVDTSDENPCNLAGIQRWRRVDAGLTVQDGAILIGRLALLEANADKRKGNFTHSGEIRDDAGQLHPAWAVRAGDTVVIEDGDETEEQRIISTSYDDDSYTVSAAIGGTPDRLDALLGRLAVVNGAGGF